MISDTIGKRSRPSSQQEKKNILSRLSLSWKEIFKAGSVPQESLWSIIWGELSESWGFLYYLILKFLSSVVLFCFFNLRFYLVLSGFAPGFISGHSNFLKVGFCVSLLLSMLNLHFKGQLLWDCFKLYCTTNQNDVFKMDLDWEISLSLIEKKFWKKMIHFSPYCPINLISF